MLRTITLIYRRTGETYQGVILRDEVDDVAFSGFKFADMIQTLHTLLHQSYSHDSPLPRVVLKRQEREGLLPYLLDSGTVQLILTDPAAAVASMNFTPKAVDLRTADKKKLEKTRQRESVEIPRGIRAGVDTLADAFGDDVYLRVRRGQVECPCCGRWTELSTQSISCSCRGVALPVSLVIEGRWVAVKIGDVLCHEAERYFLPRAWNTKGPWISHEGLKQMYEQYLKEKETACSTIQTSSDPMV